MPMGKKMEQLKISRSGEDTANKYMPTHNVHMYLLCPFT